MAARLWLVPKHPLDQEPVDVERAFRAALHYGYDHGVQVEHLDTETLRTVWRETLTTRQQGRVLHHRPRSPLWCVGWTHATFGPQIRYNVALLDTLLTHPDVLQSPCVAGMLALVDRLTLHAPYAACVQIESHRAAPALYRLTGDASPLVSRPMEQALSTSLALTREMLRLARLSLSGARIVAVMS